MLHNKQKVNLVISLIALWFLMFSARPAYAYLDPGSGSMILQILLGGAAALAVVLKLYWYSFLGLLGIDKKKIDDTKSDHS